MANSGLSQGPYYYNVFACDTIYYGGGGGCNATNNLAAPNRVGFAYYKYQPADSFTPVISTSIPPGTYPTGTTNNVTTTSDPQGPVWVNVYVMDLSLTPSPTIQTWALGAQNSYNMVFASSGVYMVQVIATNNAGSNAVAWPTGSVHTDTSTWATYNIVDLTPPTNSTQTVLDDKHIQYSWQAPTSAYPLDHYQVDWAVSGSSAGVLVDNISTSTLSETVDYSAEPPSIVGTWAPNFPASVILTACYNTTCTSSSGTIATPTLYTFADPAANASVAAYVSSAVVTWSTLPNADTSSVVFNLYYTSGSAASTATLNSGWSSEQLTLNTLTPNTSYSYTIDAFNSQTPPVVAYMTSAPPPFWTLPAAPTWVPNNAIQVWNSSITATFVLSSNSLANPVNTQYALEATLDSTWGSGGSLQDPLYSSPILTQTQGGSADPGSTQSLTVSVPNGGPYFLRIHVFSFAGPPTGFPPNPNDNFLYAPGSYPTKFNAPALIQVDSNPSDISPSYFTLVISPNVGQWSTPPGYLNVQMTCTDMNDSPSSGTVLAAITSTALSSTATATLQLASMVLPSGQSVVGNAACTNMQGQLSNQALTDTSVWVPVSPVPATAYTLPSPPSLVNPNNPNLSANNISAEFIYALNTSSTAYRLEACLDSSFSTATIYSSNWIYQPQGAVGTTSPPLTVTVAPGSSGATYYLRFRAQSFSGNPTYDAFSPTFSVTLLLNPGIVVARDTSTITAQWSLSAQAINPPVSQLQASATNYQGNPAGTPQPQAATTSPVLTVTGLPWSNTSYTLALDSLDSNGNLLATYPGSWVVGLTSAAVPSIQPPLVPGGTSTNLNFAVNIATDTNASNSLYAIEIVNPSGNVMYLNGSGGSGVSPTWLTRSGWSATGANQLIGVSPNSTYWAQVLVRQWVDNATLASSSMSILTPGAVTIVSAGIPNSMGSIDNVTFGVPLATPYQITFNTTLNASTNWSQFVTVQTLPCALGSNCAVTPTISLSNGSPSTLSIGGPGGSWQSNTIYNVQVLSGLPDTYGFTSTGTAALTFLTVPSPSGTSNVLSPADPTGTAAQLQVNLSAINQNSITPVGFAVVRTQLLSPTYAITAPSLSSLSNVTFVGNPLRTVSGAEVDFYQPLGYSPPPAINSPIQSLPSQSAPLLTLCVQGANLNTLSELDPSSLAIYLLDPANNGSPTKIASTAVSGSCYQTALTQSGVFLLAGILPTSLSGAYAYPVPFRPSLGHTQITFKNLAVDSIIKIYTIMGELVRTLVYPNDGSGVVVWNPVTNDHGDNVASGVYIYQIKNEYSEQRGKLIIIR
jgi:hypothetical protein